MAYGVHLCQHKMSRFFFMAKAIVNPPSLASQPGRGLQTKSHTSEAFDAKSTLEDKSDRFSANLKGYFVILGPLFVTFKGKSRSELPTGDRIVTSTCTAAHMYQGLRKL